MNKIVLAVDLGGTNIRMAAVTASGEILHLARGKTPANVTPAELLDITEYLAAECRKTIGGGRGIGGIGFAAPAPAAKDCEGVLTKLPNIPSLNGMNLAAELGQRFSLPVTLENDATAAAIGEHWLGAARSVRNSIMITLGTGVGGGLIIENEPYRGVDGTAGEIGHIAVEPDGYPCGCGSRGCLEQYASATAIVRSANEAGLSLASSRDIFASAEGGDPVAQAVFNTMARYLGIALAGLTNTFNPELVVIGGGVAAGWTSFIEPLRTEIRARAFDAPAKRAVLVRSILGDNAGLLGVARSAFRSLEDRF